MLARRAQDERWMTPKERDTARELDRQDWPETETDEAGTEAKRGEDADDERPYAPEFFGSSWYEPIEKFQPLHLTVKDWFVLCSSRATEKGTSRLHCKYPWRIAACSTHGCAPPPRVSR